MARQQYVYSGMYSVHKIISSLWKLCEKECKESEEYYRGLSLGMDTDRNYEVSLAGTEWEEKYGIHRFIHSDNMLVLDVDVYFMSNIFTDHIYHIFDDSGYNNLDIVYYITSDNMTTDKPMCYGFLMAKADHSDWYIRFETDIGLRTGKPFCGYNVGRMNSIEHICEFLHNGKLYSEASELIVTDQTYKVCSANNLHFDGVTCLTISTFLVDSIYDVIEEYLLSDISRTLTLDLVIDDIDYIGWFANTISKLKGKGVKLDSEFQKAILITPLTKSDEQEGGIYISTGKMSLYYKKHSGDLWNLNGFRDYFTMYTRLRY